MKRLFIFFILLIPYSSVIFCQTVDGQFITNINYPTYEVTIAVNMASGTGSAAIVLLEFTYNSSALSFPASPIKDTDYILYGEFDNYTTQNILHYYSPDRVRVALSTFIPPIFPLSTTPSNFITLYFNIIDQQASSNLTWRTIQISPGIPNNYTIGNWPNLDQALPVELACFTGKLVDENEVDLNWVTKTEISNYGFNIERRINEEEWNTIGFVEGHGNSNSPKEYSYIDNDIFAGGSSFQYRLKQIDTDGKYEYSDIVEVEIMPTQFELSQNFPNPFNPSTTIRFSLPKETQLKINIYNMLGELVETLAEGTYEAGYHKVIMNASPLPSGAYVYRIESADFVQVRKMVLIK